MCVDVNRWRLQVAFDGRPFFGWQRQTSGRDVQSHVETALKKIFGVETLVHGCSRTDSGVHALGLVAHFDQPDETRDFSVSELLRAINAHLPPAIRVMRLSRADKDFHARFDASGKRYEYRIVNSRILLPLEIGRAWHVPTPLDLRGMRQAARHLVGRHDFVSFSVRSENVRETTVRTVYKVSISAKGSLIVVAVEGDGFLYRMVRSIVGALVFVGKRKAPPEWVKERLLSGNREHGVVTAPPEGLYLVKVFYGCKKRGSQSS